MKEEYGVDTYVDGVWVANHLTHESAVKWVKTRRFADKVVEFVDNETQVYVPRRCPLCAKDTHLVVRKRGYRAWQGGHAFFDSALPELSDAEHERLLSGMCETCYEEV